jgi:hypothetical protein
MANIAAYESSHGFEFIAYLRVFFFSLYRSIAESRAWWVSAPLSGLVGTHDESVFINMDEAAVHSW